MCADYEDGTELERKWRKARKEHRCVACGEAIRSGDQYHVWAIIQDGAWSKAKHCARCYAMMEALWEVGAEAVDWYLNCGETWESAFGEAPPDDVARLAFLTPDEARALPR